ncbi:S-formylglutathione hydrolase [Palleronia caenipelagi]|uniref:S-formylglutathione hydrolase n=1 Tax=Palleronia caenipelagi TaxID=2489174 RepID=A0A547Q0K5_9RHOB|nr:S-formylglutathione hydrolase [Palleronia caenipelagi]TRD19828.1 S-formylglutathione hydrolase [Palleronia caenipelagi]
METRSENICFGGVQGVYTHSSETCASDMTFGLFLPEEAKTGPVPVLWFLSGLTCTHENAMTKAGAQAIAAETGVALIFPDTSPRGEGVADDESFDMGQGASYYVNATESPWASHFRMWDYLTEELPALVGAEFPLDMDRQAITGHSMGGHGALTIGMALGRDRFTSISAFAPLCRTMDSDWGTRQFGLYLGEDREKWRPHDASEVMRDRGFDGPVLVDTGTADQFWDKLKPTALATAMADRRQQGAFRLQPGYDHSYFFISTFIEEHVAFHAEALYG